MLGGCPPSSTPSSTSTYLSGLFDFAAALRNPAHYQCPSDAGRDEQIALAIFTAVQSAMGSSQREILFEISKVNENVSTTAEMVVDTA